MQRGTNIRPEITHLTCFMINIFSSEHLYTLYLTKVNTDPNHPSDYKKRLYKGNTNKNKTK